MGALKSLLHLSLLWWVPAQSYNTNRYICETPASEDVCQFLDNPNLMHIIQTRYGGSESVRLPTRVLVEDVPLASRQGIYFDEQRPENLMKHINFGYLNLNQPISSMGDLIDMESDEIGSHYIPKTKPPTVSAWKMDDVKTLLAAPKVLPDIMLNQEEEELPLDVTHNHHYLDEDDAKLGRFVVNDSPAKIPDIIQTEDSELTQETQDISHSEIGEKYLSDPARYRTKAHTLVIDKVVPRKEKEQNFMEELFKIKQALALAQEAEALDQKEALDLAHEEAPVQVFPIAGSVGVTPQHTSFHNDIIEPKDGPIGPFPRAVADPKAVLPEAVVPQYVQEAVVPEAVVPEAVVPEAVVPDAVVPEAVVPEAVFQQAVFPEAVVPEAVVPEAAVPEAVVPEAVVPESSVPEAIVPEAVVPESSVPEAIVPEYAVPEAAVPETTHEAVAPEAVDPEAVDPEAADHEDLGPEAVVTSEHIPELEDAESPSVIGHEEPAAPEQCHVEDQAHSNGMETFPYHSDNNIEKEGNMKKIEHVGKTSTLDPKAEKTVGKSTHHLATEVPADKALCAGDSPKVIVVAEEDFVSNDDGGDFAPKKKCRKSSKSQKISKVDAATESLYFLPAKAAYEIPTGDGSNMTKKRKKSKSSKKKTPKVGLVPEGDSTIKENLEQKVKKQTSPKLEKVPETPETPLSTETSIEKPSVVAVSDTPKSQDESANHQDSLLDGLLRVL